MHFLVFFAEEDKTFDVRVVDCIVCTEFPNLEEDLVLYDTILRTMVQSPCRPHNFNSTCIKDENCLKCYPKTFQESIFIMLMHIHCIVEGTTLVVAMRHVIVGMLYLTIHIGLKNMNLAKGCKSFNFDPPTVLIQNYFLLFIFYFLKKVFKNSPSWRCTNIAISDSNFQFFILFYFPYLHYQRYKINSLLEGWNFCNGCHINIEVCASIWAAQIYLQRSWLYNYALWSWT